MRQYPCGADERAQWLIDTMTTAAVGMAQHHTEPQPLRARDGNLYANSLGKEDVEFTSIGTAHGCGPHIPHRLATGGPTSHRPSMIRVRSLGTPCAPLKPNCPRGGRTRGWQRPQPTPTHGTEPKQTGFEDPSNISRPPSRGQGARSLKLTTTTPSSVVAPEPRRMTEQWRKTQCRRRTTRSR